MPSAKPVFMEVRPFQVSHLCFEVGGILGESSVELGTDVAAFDFGSFYKDLRAGSLSDPATGRLVFDSNGIDKKLNIPRFRIKLPDPHEIDPPEPDPHHPDLEPDPRPLVLAKLRAEPLRAALDKAINTRANAFITKYGGVASIAAIMRRVFNFRGDQLTRLSGLSDNMTNVLDDAYKADPTRSGAVKTTITRTEVLSTPGQTQTTTVQVPGSPGVPKTIATQVSTGPPGTPKENQTATTDNVEFRAPIFENLARNQRAQISLGQEIISFTAESHYLDRLEEVFANELASIDADVNRMQVAYLNTILMSPIDGTLTGVYKNPGDSVSAGEPVFRVENDAVVLIVATLLCHGPVSIGSTLNISTTPFDGPGPPVIIGATIVAARGRGDDDDQWEVIGKMPNVDAGGKKIFPLGYRFDNENTEVSIFEPFAPGEG